jgi:hypothetical protein
VGQNSSKSPPRNFTRRRHHSSEERLDTGHCYKIDYRALAHKAGSGEALQSLNSSHKIDSIQPQRKYLDDLENTWEG